MTEPLTSTDPDDTTCAAPASGKRAKEGAANREPVKEATLDSVAGEEDPGASLDLVMPPPPGSVGSPGKKGG